MVNYNCFAETFSNSRQNLLWPEIDYFISYLKENSFIKNKKNTLILDIWCWNWRLLKYLKNLNFSFDYLWIDSSIKMITEAKKSFKEYKFKLLKMENVDKLKTKFDIIFLIASFHHIDWEKKRLDVLKKIKNCLNLNGYVFFTNWNLLEINNFKKYKSSFLWNWDFKIKIWSYLRYYHWFNINELNNLFKISNFNILENKVFDWNKNIISIINKTN